MMAGPSLAIDEVQRRAIVAIEAAPDDIVAVHGDRVVHLQRLRGPSKIVEVFLKLELRRVDTNHDQSLIPVFVGPTADIGKRAQPVDAAVAPEVDEDDLSAQS